MTRKYKFTSTVSVGGAITEEWLDKTLKDMRERANSPYLPTPNYTQMPISMVREYLKEGIIPQFVIVSPASLRLIKDYVKKHPEKFDKENAQHQ